MGASDFSLFTAFKAKDGVSPVLTALSRKTTAVDKVFDKLTSTTKGFGSCMQSTLQKANFMMGAIAGNFVFQKLKSGIFACTDAASDLQETIGKTGEVFKENTSIVINWAETANKSMGLSRQTALDAASLYGDMATGMGMSTKRAAEMSMSLTQLSADLASFKNISQDISKNALQGIFTGQTKALVNLGIVMNEANLQEFALSKGITKRMSDMTQAEKIELRYAYVIKQTKNAQGDFLRTGGNYANQSRMLTEQRKELLTNIGELVRPSFTSVMKKLNALFLKYSPIIVKNFKWIFDSLKPAFDETGKLFSYLSSKLIPEFTSKTPLIKNVFENIIVPGCVIAIKALGGLCRVIEFAYNVIKNVFNFIKNNWLISGLLLAGTIYAVSVQIVNFTLKTASMIKGLWTLALTFKQSQLYYELWCAVMIRAEAVSVFYGKALVLLRAKMASTLAGVKMLSAGFVTLSKAVLTGILSFAKAALGFAPWLLIIGAVIGGIVLLIKNWDWLKEKWSAGWNFIISKAQAVILKLKTLFGTIGNFIKEHFIDILLVALGPIRMIINTLRHIPEILKALNIKGEAFEIKTKDGNKNPVKEPKIKENPQKGKIGVEVNLSNKTDKNASVYTSLESSNSLMLNPA